MSATLHHLHAAAAGQESNKEEDMQVRKRSHTISVIIPTYNEEELISTLLKSLSALEPDEIIVADGNSSDRTVAIAERFAKIALSEKGRGTQLNAGARVSSGSILLFLHADTRLGSGSLRMIRQRMEDPKIVGGNFDVRFEGDDLASAAFTRLNRWRRRFGIFYGDSGIFCRRQVFEELGGYQSWPILEDYEFARRLRRAGKLATLNEPIWVSDRRWRSAGVLPTVWTWLWIQTFYLAGVRPEWLAAWYTDARLANAPSVRAAPEMTDKGATLPTENIL